MRNRATTRLAKPKFRQSWSKYNLYNLSRMKAPNFATRTFFQQKWEAKALARSYHGEQVRERQWQLMFNRRIRSVVSIDPEYLGSQDGSNESSGRGSGLDMGLKAAKLKRQSQTIPYQQMTFAPLERRLDVAVFRALFASSTRQARQFVLHGAVKVNGKKMPYPGYLLNPGDLFQVDPERVLFATGAPKDYAARKAARKMKAESSKTLEEEDAEQVAEEATAEVEKEAEKEAAEAAQKKAEKPEDHKETLKSLIADAKKILTGSTSLSAKRKQDFRAFRKSVKRVLSKSSNSTILTESLEAQFLELQNQLNVDKARKKGEQQKDADKESKTTSSETAEATDSSTSDKKPSKYKQLDEPDMSEKQLLAIINRAAKDPKSEIANEDGALSDLDISIIQHALANLRDNPVDHTKPYATPWQPRPFMSAFAFIPRYLEVNPNICAAVYIRHPVARPGFAEVPSPLTGQAATLAYNWYLRRG